MREEEGEGPSFPSLLTPIQCLRQEREEREEKEGKRRKEEEEDDAGAKGVLETRVSEFMIQLLSLLRLRVL